MKPTLLAILVSLVTVSSPTLSYEWKSHNKMALYARRISDAAAANQELKAFLETFGEQDLDTRAGDKTKDAFTDEDHNEGFLQELMWCTYRERDCWNSGTQVKTDAWLLPCTLDHFHPRLPLPLVNEDATVHARRYFDMAVKLYKAAKCNNQGMHELYEQWAARALGHAIHLVQDMGSPQHAKPENHAPYPFGHGPSFHEYWTLDLWDLAKKYTSPDGQISTEIGFFDQAAGQATTPRLGRLEGIMGSLAGESRQFLSGSPYQPGTTLPLTELLRVTTASDPQINWVETPGSGGYGPIWGFESFSLHAFPSYTSSLPHDGRHVFFLFNNLADPDFDLEGPLAPPDHGALTTMSFELAERLWAEGDPQYPENPVALNGKINDLLRHTTEASAGAILAFWDEVKNFKCPCNDFTPCSFHAGAGGPDCSGYKRGPKTPGGDNPDDAWGVVSTTSAVTTPAVADFSNPDLLTHWRSIAAVGVEKGLPSLVDFGRTMYLLSL